MNNAPQTDPLVIQNPSSLAFQCPQCHFDSPEAEVANNPSTDRWFVCPSCGHKWSVSPIADN